MNEWAFWYLIKRHDALWRFVVKYSPLIPSCFNRDLKRHVRSFLVSEVRLDMGTTYSYSKPIFDGKIIPNTVIWNRRCIIIRWMKREALTRMFFPYLPASKNIVKDIIWSTRIEVKILVLIFSSMYKRSYEEIVNDELDSLTVRVYASFDWTSSNTYDFVFVHVRGLNKISPEAERWLNKSKSLILY